MDMDRTYAYRLEIGSKFSVSTSVHTGTVIAKNPYEAFCAIRLHPLYTGQPVQEIIIQNLYNGHIHTWHPFKG